MGDSSGMPVAGVEQVGLPRSRTWSFPDDTADGRRRHCRCLPEFIIQGRGILAGPEMMASVGRGSRRLKICSHGDPGANRQEGWGVIWRRGCLNVRFQRCHTCWS